jgi:hypothetical protein
MDLPECEAVTCMTSDALNSLEYERIQETVTDCRKVASAAIGAKSPRGQYYAGDADLRFGRVNSDPARAYHVNIILPTSYSCPILIMSYLSIHCSTEKSSLSRFLSSLSYSSPAIRV